MVTNVGSLVDLIPMTQHSRASESAFTSHVHDLHKKISKKIRKVMPIIRPMLICITGILFNKSDYVMIQIRNGSHQELLRN